MMWTVTNVSITHYLGNSHVHFLKLHERSRTFTTFFWILLHSFEFVWIHLNTFEDKKCSKYILVYSNAFKCIQMYSNVFKRGGIGRVCVWRCWWWSSVEMSSVYLHLIRATSSGECTAEPHRATVCTLQHQQNSFVIIVFKKRQKSAQIRDWTSRCTNMSTSKSTGSVWILVSLSLS